MENPIKMDDLGVLLFSENIHIPFFKPQILDSQVFRPGLPVRVSLQMSRPGGEAVTQQERPIHLVLRYLKSLHCRERFGANLRFVNTS